MAAIFSFSSCLRLQAVPRTLLSVRGISDMTCPLHRSGRLGNCLAQSTFTQPAPWRKSSPVLAERLHHGQGFIRRTASSLSSRISNFTMRNMHTFCIRHREPSTCRFSIPAIRSFSLSAQHLAKKRELVTIHFINRDGEKMTVKAWTGQNLLDIVVDNDLDIDGYGACEGTLSCSTCHLIFSEELFKILPRPSDEELDMLDLAYGQTDMSRLGCQVILTKEMDGMTVIVPEGVADARDV